MFAFQVGQELRYLSRLGPMERIALIGYGAIGQLVLDRCLSGTPKADVVAVIARPQSVARVQSMAPASVKVTSSIAQAIEFRPTLFVECAGHAALREHAPDVLRAGADLLVASVGALADAELELALRGAAQASGASVLLPAGAIGGLDALGAARIAGLDSVEYTSVKSVRSWRGSHAEKLLDLDQVRERSVFFTGNARQAARLFPQNANVAATVALAGIGFEGTIVRLTVDPEVRHNLHYVRAVGTFGSIEVAIGGQTLASNPKTSILAPMSLLRAIESRSLAMRVV